MVITTLFVILFGGIALQAQQEMNLYVNVGLVTDKEFTFDPFLWSGGVSLDIHLGQQLMLSPECNVIFEGFKFDTMWLQPGVLVNLKLSSLFVGAGITKRFKLTDNVFASELLLKLNGGFSGKKYRLVAYIETPFDNIFGKYAILLGAQLGFVF